MKTGSIARAGAWLLLLLLAGPLQGAPVNAQRFTTADGLPSNVVHALLEDQQGYLWFATDDGLARFDGRRFRVWRMEQGLPDNQVTALARDEHDQLWLGTSQGQLVRVSADRQHVESIGTPRVSGLVGVPIVAVLPGPGGEVWFGTRGAGLFRMDDEGRLRQYLPTVRGDGVPSRTVEHLVFSADGTLWVGTPQGLARWREDRFLAPEPASLARVPVTALLVARAGDVWVGGSAGPWVQTPPQLPANASTRSTPASSTPVFERVEASTGTRALGGSRLGGPWLADGARVWQMGRESPSISLAALTDGLEPQFRAAFEDRHGGVWLLGRHLGVWRLPPHWRHFQAVDADPPRIAFGAMTLAGTSPQVLRCAGGSTWTISASSVALRADPAAPVRQWPRVQGGAGPSASPQVIHCDGNDRLWWGGTQGLQRWSEGRLLPMPGAEDEVNALHVADDGGLWVASPGVLRRYRVSESGLQHSVRIDERHGLPALRMTGLATDAQGVIWATSARGLLRVQPRQGRVRVYTRLDGVPDPVFSAPLQAEGHQMRALGHGGTDVRFDPAGLARCRAEVSLVVDRVQVQREGLLQVMPLDSTLRFQPGDRDIQVTVRQLGPLTEAPQYRFRLQGLDTDWVRVGRRGTRGFPRLPPGTHRLEFQARQDDGHWSGSQSLTLLVGRSGWDHPLMVAARLALAGLLLSAAAWVAWRRLLRLRDRHRAAQRQAAAVQSAQAKECYLATLGHEVRTPLTGVLGVSELLLASPLTSAQRQQLERIRQGGQTLLHVLNQALDEARIEAGRMPLQTQRMDVAAVCRQWQARNVLALCRRGTGLAVCLHVGPDAGASGDPQRLMQLLDGIARTLVARTASACLVLQVWWRPGRDGLLLELAATGPRSSRRAAARRHGAVAAVPTPSRQALQDALAPSHSLAQTLGGTLQLHAGAAGRWQVRVSLALPAWGQGAAAGALRVLLVDANPLSAGHHRHLLEAQGHVVVHAHHALAALAELQAERADVVMVERELPGVGGLALLELMRARGMVTPAVLLSARPEDPSGLQAASRAAGARALLWTPSGADTVDEALRQALAG